MSSPYDRYDRRSRRGVWSHWVPLAITVTVATVGLAAWAWNQRKDDEGDYDYAQDQEPHLDYENADYGDNPPYGATNRDGIVPRQRPRQEDEAYDGVSSHAEASGSNWGARMSGALRRTPSPQQFFDSTGKTVAAGVAAAGAAMGKALASIREEDKYPDDSRVWSEEADAKKDRVAGPSSKRRRTVAVVVSADTELGNLEDDDAHEHAVRMPCHQTAATSVS